MTNYKIKTIRTALLLTLLLGLAIVVSSILSGCSMSFATISLSNANYMVNRIIYTNNPDKYLDNATFLPTDNNGDTILTDPSGKETTITLPAGFSLIETADSRVLDIVIEPQILSTHPNSPYPRSLSMTWESLLAADGSHEMAHPILNNNYLFSEFFEIALANGHEICLTENCICGWNRELMGSFCGCIYDTWDKIPYRYDFTSDHKLNEDEVFIKFATEEEQLGCRECFTYIETDNGNGTYTYASKNICDHTESEFIHDGGWQNATWPSSGFYGVYFLGSEYANSITPDYRELIIDGFDVLWIYDYIISMKDTYNEIYVDDGWEQYYNPTSYRHMFSNIPAEKITIKNMTGLDNATDLSSMFENCVNLREVDFGNLFEKCQPTNISKMFYNCPQLESVDLSSLDTSKVTDMSDMFNLRPKLSAESRKSKTEEFINYVIQQELIPELAFLNDGTIYTIESLVEKFGATETEIYVIVMQISKQLNMQLDIPITYNEYSLITYEMDFPTLLEKALTDPTSLGLSDVEYSFYDILIYLNLEALSSGSKLIHEIQLKQVSTREKMILGLVLEFLANDSKESFVQELEQSTPEMKEQLILEFFTELYPAIREVSNIIIPISYEEFCLLTLGMTLDEMIEQAYNNPMEIFGTIPVHERWTKDIAKVELLRLLTQFGYICNFVVVQNDELDTFFTGNYSRRGELILGNTLNTASKFVINEGTNVDNFFGDCCDFKTVITPSKIGSDIKLTLTNHYTCINFVIDHIDSDFTNATFSLTPDKELTTHQYAAPEKFNGKGFIAIVIGVVGALLVGVFATIRIAIKRKKNFERSIYMSTRY